MSNRVPRTTAVIASIAAQADNLGDIEIRRTALDVVGGDATKFIVWRGSMPDEYVRAIPSAHDSRHLYSSLSPFLWAVAKSYVSDRIVLLLAPGPSQLNDGLRPVSKRAAMALAALAVRLQGGSIVSMGRAFTGNGPLSRWLETILSLASMAYSVRDGDSESALGFSVEVLPDLAFAAHPTASNTLGPDAGRSFVALSFRADDAPNEKLVEKLVREIRHDGLVPIFVTQVRRDDRRHQEFAKAFDAEVLDWPDARPHSEQLKRVRKIYRESAFVVSNRLHALIFGIESGAHAVEADTSGRRKIETTLGSLGLLSGTLVMRDPNHHITGDWEQVTRSAADPGHAARYADRLTQAEADLRDAIRRVRASLKVS